MLLPKCADVRRPLLAVGGGAGAGRLTAVARRAILCGVENASGGIAAKPQGDADREIWTSEAPLDWRRGGANRMVADVLPSRHHGWHRPAEHCNSGVAVLLD